MAALPTPGGADVWGANLNTAIESLAQGPGTHAARPTTGLVKGTLYSCTDHGIIEEWNGTAWVNYTLAAGVTQAAGASIGGQTAAQSIPGNTGSTTVNFDTTVRADSGFTVDLAANTITVVDAGWYLAVGRLGLSTGTTAEWFLNIPAMNLGAEEFYGSTAHRANTISGVAYLAAGTVVSLVVANWGAGALTADANVASTYLRLVKLSAAPGPQQLLAVNSYAPGPEMNYALTTTTSSVVNASANVTFVAPASGNVVIDAVVPYQLLVPVDTGSGGGNGFFLGLHNGTAAVGTPYRAAYIGAQTKQGQEQRTIRPRWVVTGLTPGTSYTYNLTAWKFNTTSIAEVHADAGAAWGPIIMSVSDAAPVGSRSGSGPVKKMRRTAGDVTVVATSQAELPGVTSTMDIVLMAKAGDVLLVGIDMSVDNGTGTYRPDVYTVVSGALTNSISGNANNYGVAGWTRPSGAFGYVSGMIPYTVQAGDVVNNQVTLRLTGKVDSGSRIAGASAGSPLTFFAQNTTWA